MQITLREYQEQDFDELQDIIQETWHYDDFASRKTASKLAGAFLSSCLTNYTFSRVAVYHGKAVGIILAKDIEKHKCPLKHRLKQIQYILSLYLSKEGRQVSKIFVNVDGVDKQLLAASHRSYPAELALFAVSSSCRGKGVGKMLFQSVLAYLNEQELSEFYLFTDTSCNYGFYEHQGMVRRCEKELLLSINGQSAKMNFFIYDYHCDSPLEPSTLSSF